MPKGKNRDDYSSLHPVRFKYTSSNLDSNLPCNFYNKENTKFRAIIAKD